MPGATATPAAGGRCADNACGPASPACGLTRALRLCAVLVLLLAADQATKVYARRHWRPTHEAPLTFAGGTLRIQYAENPGAFLSLFGGLAPEVRFWMLTVFNAVILGGVGICLLAGKPGDRWSWTALALILAGGLGNLIDRVRFENHVIDFLILSTGPWDVPYFGEVRTGIFNIADMAITAGFLMLLPGVFRSHPQPSPPRSSGPIAAAGNIVQNET